MSFYPVASPAAIPGVEAIAGLEAVGAGQATLMVAVPVAALRWPVRPGSDEDGRSGWVVEGAPPVRSGEPVVWCKVVAVTPAAVRRDGRVQAQGRPSDWPAGAPPALRGLLGAARLPREPESAGRPVARLIMVVSVTSSVTLPPVWRAAGVRLNSAAPAQRYVGQLTRHKGDV